MSYTNWAVQLQKMARDLKFLIYFYFTRWIMHQSFVSTAPPPPLTGMGGDNDFTFQSPGISPALRGHADGNNPALSATLHNRKSHRGKIPNVKSPVISRHCGDN